MDGRDRGVMGREGSEVKGGRRERLRNIGGDNFKPRGMKLSRVFCFINMLEEYHPFYVSRLAIQIVCVPGLS